MRIAAPLLLFAVFSVPSLITAQTATLRRGNPSPEDSKLRAEAVGVLEKANRTSTPVAWPPNQMRLHFHVPDPEPGYPSDGDYTYDFGGPTLRRKEWNYGAFQFVQTRNGLRLNMNNTSLHEPAVLELLPKLTPIFLVHFDQQDIIRGRMEADAFSSIQSSGTVSNRMKSASMDRMDGCCPSRWVTNTLATQISLSFMPSTCRVTSNGGLRRPCWSNSIRK